MKPIMTGGNVYVVVVEGSAGGDTGRGGVEWRRKRKNRFRKQEIVILKADKKTFVAEVVKIEWRWVRYR